LPSYDSMYQLIYNMINFYFPSPSLSKISHVHTPIISWLQAALHYVCNLFLHSHMSTRDHPLILLIIDMSEFNVNVFCAIVDLSRLDEIHLGCR